MAHGVAVARFASITKWADHSSGGYHRFRREIGNAINSAPLPVTRDGLGCESGSFCAQDTSRLRRSRISRRFRPSPSAKPPKTSALAIGRRGFAGFRLSSRWDIANQVILREGASAETADGGIEAATTGFIGGDDLGGGLVGTAVQVDSDFQIAVLRHHCRNNFLNFLWRATPTVSAREIVRISWTSSNPTAATTSSTLQGSLYGLPKAIEM